MEGFKSFGSRTVTVRLSSGFTCIVGPNGAGKSNIIDALCFALGRLSKKTMRAKSLEDLIFAGARGKKEANRAKVTLYFDNSDGLFPGGPETDFTISRTIKRGGGGGYKMNGKSSTRANILNALATANVDPDGTNQFVLQGKIVELTHMNPENRREFIEDLIGLSFVVCQIFITRYAKTVARMYESYISENPESKGSLTVPNKDAVINYGTNTYKNTGISIVKIINTFANYFKHQDEWSYDWGNPSPQSKNTINTLLALGATCGSTGNFRLGAELLGNGEYSDWMVYYNILKSWITEYSIKVRSELGIT